MSVPVQVVYCDDVEMVPTIEKVCRHLKTVRGIQSAWWLEDDVGTMFETIVQRQYQEMLTASGHEGGFYQVIIGASWLGLKNITDRILKLEQNQRPLARIAIVLENESREPQLLADIFKCIHMVPNKMDYRRELRKAECIQIVGNILGMILELSRPAKAYHSFNEWVERYKGVHITIAKAARFQAPVAYENLTKRLASKVTGVMAQALKKGKSPYDGIPPIKLEHDFNQATVKRISKTISEEIGETILGDGDFPKVDELRRRATKQAERLPQLVQEQISEYLADRDFRSWHQELREYIDTKLSLEGFAAILPLVLSLTNYRKKIRKKLDSLIDEVSNKKDTNKNSDKGRSALEEFPFVAPSDRELIESWVRFELEHHSRENSVSLFMSWALLITAFFSIVMYPVADWCLSSLHYNTTGLLGRVLANPNGYSLGFGLVFLLLAGVILFLGRNKAEHRSNFLKKQLDQERRQYRKSWEKQIVPHIKKVKTHLEIRTLRFALEALELELLKLTAVKDKINHLGTIFNMVENRRINSISEFDSDIRLPNGFYDEAEKKGAHEQLFKNYEELLCDSNWRFQLEFMDTNQVTGRCGYEYREFREQIPFADHEDLTDKVIEPSKASLNDMMDKLEKYISRDEPADWFYVVPGHLKDCVSENNRLLFETYYGTCDLFAVVTKSVIP